MIQYIKEIDNVEINALSKRSNYKIYSKVIKFILIRKKEHLRLTEITEKNVNIIN